MEVNQTREKGIKLNFPQLMIKLTIVYCILFPADKINIKEIILLLTFVVCAPGIFNELKKRSNLKLLFYAVVFPACLLFYALIIGVDMGFSISYGYVWIYLLLIPAIKEYRVDIKKTFIYATSIVALIIDFIYMADVLGLISIFSNPMVLFFSNMGELQYGKGLLATFGYSIFYKSSPLLFYTYGYYLHKKKYFKALFFLLAFIASGTRANFYVAILVTIAVVVINSRKTAKTYIVIIGMLCVALCMAPSVIDRMASLNVLKYGRSDSIKISDIKSIFLYMNEQPWRYILGSGVGSAFFSHARNAYVTVVEASYFDYFRQVGIVGFCFFINFLLMPVYRNKRHIEERWLIIAYVAYLTVAFTNPLLVNSTAFIGYVLLLSDGMTEREVKEIEK